MRKSHLIAIALSLLSMFVIAQLASAETQRICQDHYKIFWTNVSAGCTAANHCKQYPIQGGLGFRDCFDVSAPPKPTSSWNGARGYGTAQSPSTAYRSR